MKQILRKDGSLNKIPDGTVIEFVEKDFEKKEEGRRLSQVNIWE